MLDIGQVHRIEYEIEDDRLIPVAAVEAPGRIHFLGEQGDSSSGFFLSAAIDRYVQVAVSLRKDNSFRFFAADTEERKRSTLLNFKYKREDRWANYLKTSVFVFIRLGYPMKGVNFSFCGDIPQQIALGSSVAIEVAAAVALCSLLRVQLDEMDLARKLYEAHIDFFGKEASLADYQVCFLARKNQFLFIDASSNKILKMKSPFSQFKFLIIDSRVPYFGAEKELASRKADTEQGLKFLSLKLGGEAFKDFGSGDLLEVLGDFPEKIRRRTIHVVEEIERIKDAIEALRRGDIASFAKIVFRSHESLRDLYEISCPEIDWLVKRAQEIEGAAGARMTGLGFGGCIYAIFRKELVEDYKMRLEEYERIFGFRPVIYEVNLATGARLLKLQNKK